MKNSKKLILGIAAAIVCAGLVYGAVSLYRVKAYRDKVNAISFSNIDISSVPDGSYTGEYDADMVMAKVEVVVQGGRIIDIKLLEHKNDRGAAAEVIPSMIIESQNIDVDAIASATNSSQVIKKAVDNALNTAVK